jgi:DtxR family Mn-dependent transcriptional regulator
MDMGVVPGTRISAAFRSASGDPVAYRILGATLAIRKAQADHIYIQKIAPSEKQGL